MIDGAKSMADQRANEIDLIEQSAQRAQHVSGILSKAFGVLLWLSIGSFSVILLLMVIRGVESYSSGDAVVSALPFVKILLEAVLIVCIVSLIKRSFEYISKGHSPFSKLQARRLRLIAVFLLAHALLTTVISPGILNVAGMGETTVGVAIGAVSSESDRIIPINAGDIVLAIVLFCAALIVEYGSLLQKLSDDTL